MFDDLWKFCTENTRILAQDKVELEHVFNLMLGCNSYLEIGTSEGNSLYILGHALAQGGKITYLDRNEEHTKNWRMPKEEILLKDGYNITAIHGDSHDSESIKAAQMKRYDCVLIDAGHRYKDVIQDARAYGLLADKYIFFHDIRITETMDAFLDWLQETGNTAYIIVNSKNFGFGIVKK